MMQSKMTKLLQIEHPIIQAPMAGGITTSSLVSSVSNAGGLGMIGAGYMSSSQIRDQIREVKQLTKKNFGINLFIPSEFNVSESAILKANQLLQPIKEQLNLKTFPINFPLLKMNGRLFMNN